MFTGIVEEVGHIAQVTPMGHGPGATRRHRRPTTVAGADPGDSIAVNGVCLTVADLLPTGFSADVMSETAAPAPPWARWPRARR